MVLGSSLADFNKLTDFTYLKYYFRVGQDQPNIKHFYTTNRALPGWLSGERVGLITWWLRVRSPVEETFLSGVFSPLTSAEACEKSSQWLWKEKLC